MENGVCFRTPIHPMAHCTTSAKWIRIVVSLTLLFCDSIWRDVLCAILDAWRCHRTLLSNFIVHKIGVQSVLSRLHIPRSHITIRTHTHTCAWMGNQHAKLHTLAQMSRFLFSFSLFIFSSFFFFLSLSLLLLDVGCQCCKHCHCVWHFPCACCCSLVN